MKASKMSAFTLIELMVTLAVLAIIITIAVPNMSTFSKRQGVRSTADELLLSMVYARSEALKRNSNIYIFATADGWCVTESSTGCNDQNSLLRSFTLSGKNMEISGFGAQLKFNHKGIRAAGNDTFTVKNSSLPDSDMRCIKVSPTGRAAATACS